MDKIRTLLWIIALSLIFPSTVYSKSFNLLKQTYSDDPASLPERTIKTNPMSITVSYTIKECDFLYDITDPNSYICHIPGFGESFDPQYPAIPVKIDAIHIPWKAKCEIEVADMSFVDIPCRISKCKPSEPMGNTDKILNSQDITDKQWNGPADIVGEQFLRGNRILHIRVCPAEYFSETETVRVYTKLTYRIKMGSLSSYDTPQRAMNLETLPFIERDMLQNITMSTSFEIATDTIIQRPEPQSWSKQDPQSYLIVSHPKFSKEVSAFADWKRTHGIKTYVALSENWTASQIKDLVKNTHEEDNNLLYMLIIGDYEDVPSNHFKNKKAAPNSPVYSDNIYGFLDGESDYTSDVFIGRLPVSTPQEASRCIDRLIKYETEPITDLKFYQSMMAISGFDPDDNVPDMEANCFVLSSEILRRHINQQSFYLNTSSQLPLPIKYNMKRVYWAFTPQYPKYWFTGEEMPKSLQKPQYDWKGNKDVINEMINNGCVLATINTHGGDTLVDPPFYTVHNIKQLTNGRKLPFLVATSCWIGNFINDCFVEAFLRNPSGGAIGIIANTNWGYNRIGDAMLLSLINTLWTNPKISEPNRNHIYMADMDPVKNPIYNVGPLLATALERMRITCPSYVSYDGYIHKVAHIFGDPAMDLTLAPPVDSDKISISITNSGDFVVKSQYPYEFFYTGFFDKASGEVKRFRGTEANYHSNNPEETIVCISGHNRKTKIYSYKDIKSSTVKKEVKIALKSIYPSPANSNLEVVLTDESCNQLNVMLANSTNAMSYSYIIPSGVLQESINISSIPNGTYIVNIMDGDNIIGSKKIIINH